MTIHRLYKPSGPAIWTRAGGWQKPTPASQLPIFHPGNPLHHALFDEPTSSEKPSEPDLAKENADG